MNKRSPEISEGAHPPVTITRKTLAKRLREVVFSIISGETYPYRAVSLSKDPEGTEPTPLWAMRFRNGRIQFHQPKTTNVIDFHTLEEAEDYALNMFRIVKEIKGQE